MWMSRFDGIGESLVCRGCPTSVDGVLKEKVDGMIGLGRHRYPVSGIW